MIGVASRADGDIVRKTEVLRASADELALKTEEQGKDIAKLRSAIEQLKSDQSAHITRTIARMGEIDTEMKNISDEKNLFDRRTADALKDIEGIRRELVQLGAKLAKEFITLPLPVARYSRLDQSSQKDEFVLLSQNKEKERNQNSSPTGKSYGKNNNANNSNSNNSSSVNSIWYTDDQPAANLQCIDLVISSAVAALDGRLTDKEFRDEIEASRNDPESVFSKESLIRSVAAASPMKRRRASLLMLAQASRELQKQSATFDDLTRGPMRWSEAERIQAERNAQMHDGMIRDAVRELCKGAPIPRQAERQLLTALDLHTMPAYRNLDSSTSGGEESSINSGKDSPLLFVEHSSSVKSVKISQPSNLRPKTTELKRKPKSATASSGFSVTNYMHSNVSMEELGEAVERYADFGDRNSTAHYSPNDAKLREEETARQNMQMYGASAVMKPRHVSSPVSRAKDPLLRQLQAELQEEQSAMGLRSHAARVKAWQELDLKRAARNRFDVTDVLNANNLAAIEKRRESVNNINSNNNNIQQQQRIATHTNELLIPSSTAGIYSSIMMHSSTVYNPDHDQGNSSSSSSKFASPKKYTAYSSSSSVRKNNFSSPTIVPVRYSTPTSPLNPVTTNNNNNNNLQISSPSEKVNNTNNRCPTPVTPVIRNRTPNTVVIITSPDSADKNLQPVVRNSIGIASESITQSASPLLVHRSTGLIVRSHQQLHHQPPPVGEVIRKNKSNSTSFVLFTQSNNNGSPTSNYENRKNSSLTESQVLPTSNNNNNVTCARAGIPDPENATQAVSMRRTGALEAAGLSFHSSRLDEAAKRLGVVRPPSAGGQNGGAGYCARNGIGSRMHWKLKNRPHELEEEAARLMEAEKKKDPKSLD